jgi:signal transduction histidine kinase
MPVMPRTMRFGLLRSAGVRLAAVHALVFGVSALALILYLWWASTGLLTRQVDVAIRADVVALAERWRAGGAVALRDTIQDRLARGVQPDALYLLADPSLQPVAGNVQAWPTGLNSTDAVVEVPVLHNGESGLARVWRYDLADGYHLLVGRDVRTRAALRDLVESALLWAALLVALLVAAGALLVRGLFRHLLLRVSDTAAAVEAGDLTRRVQLSGRGDELDRLAALINTMLDRIGQLMEGVRAVSNNIAHDLRTPVTRARARLEDAAAHAGSADELRAATERAVIDLDGITQVFEALLRIAEIEAGARRSAFAPLDAAPLLAGLADLYGAAAEEHGLRLETEIAESLPVLGDAALLQQALANLLDNALKFSPPGGRLLLRGEAQDGRVRILVSDQGPGIPEADRARAAERFFRGEDARHTPGFGLGLALAQAVAVLHGGALLLEDAEPGLRAVLDMPVSSHHDATKS